MQSSSQPKRGCHGDFGRIRHRDTIVHFAFHTHWRPLTAVVLLAVSSALLLSQAVLASLGQVDVMSARIVPTKQRKQASTPKQDRLKIETVIDVAKVDMIESRIDGSFARYAYHRTAVDLTVIDPENLYRMASRRMQYNRDDSRTRAPFHLVLRAEEEGRTGPKAAPLTGAQESPPSLGVPINVSVAEKSPRRPAHRILSVPTRPLSLAGIESALKLPVQDRNSLAVRLGQSVIRPGERLELIVEDAGPYGSQARIDLAKFTPEQGPPRLLARVDEGSFAEIKQPSVYERLVAEALAGMQKKKASLEDQNLSGEFEKAKNEFPHLTTLLTEARVPSEVSVQVAKLVRSNNIDVARHPHLSTKLDLVFRTNAEGRDELVALSFNDGKSRQRFFRYRVSPDVEPEFFDEDGRSVSKFLLAKPVPAGRWGDKFGWRIHPILGYRKFHNGVDFPAPKGSPILAAGDGLIERIAWQAGYGNYVRIRHDPGYTTTYAHLSGTPETLKVGQRVSQGQVIAYVGSTGLSTGPHLHYELRVDGRHADPTKTRLPAGTNLKGKALEAFRDRIEHIEHISGLIDPSAQPMNANLVR